MSLAEKLQEYREKSGKEITKIAEEIGYSRPTISKYMDGKYASDTTEIDRKVRAYLLEMTGEEIPQEKAGAGIEKRQGFYESEDAKHVLGVCRSCQEYTGLGLVVGESGFGKTHALKYYSKMPKVGYIECSAVMGPGDLLDSIETELGIPSRHNSLQKRMEYIDEFCHVNKGYLVIIDEADKLISKYSQNKMEIIRWIFDQSHVGVVLSGEPELKMILKNYDNRFARRVEFYTLLQGLSRKEIEEYLQGYEIEADAFKELENRARNKATGCFRLLDRTLNNVFRLMRENGGDKITLEIIKQASSMMLL